MPPSKHAILSASSSHRWLNCNPSARLETEQQAVPTHSTQEGQHPEKLLHSVLLCR